MPGSVETAYRFGSGNRRHVASIAYREMARPTRFERVTSTFGGKRQPTLLSTADGNEGLASWTSHTGFHEKIGGETPASAVAQIVGFGLRR